MMRAVGLLLLAVLVPACSLVEPKAGATQAVCGLSAPDAGPGASGSGYAGSGASAPPALCAPDTASPCDSCESEHCCVTRSACYGDPVCACADLAFDQCVDGTTDEPPDAALELAGQCRDAFAASGSVERARVACQKAWCAGECGLL